MAKYNEEFKLSVVNCYADGQVLSQFTERRLYHMTVKNIAETLLLRFLVSNYGFFNCFARSVSTFP
tara:strand:+ start:4963 stop:5160 length:198 start_codon:yes stop_codon:yes gene_type:complete